MKKANYLCSLTDREGANVIYNFVGAESKCVLFRILAMFLLLCAAFSMAQAQDMKFVDIVASKTYPEGNQITYFTVTEMPTGQDEIDFMKQYVIENTEVTRLVIFPDQPRCMFDGDEALDVEKVVATMKEACLEWKKNHKE